MKAEGYTGTIELLDDRVRINRKKGFLDVALRGADSRGQISGETDILLEEISAVEFRKITRFPPAPGYIRIIFKGGQEIRARSYKDLKADGYTVMFRKNESDFEKIRNAIEEKRRVPKEAAGTKTSNLNDLEKLAELREKGIITEEECVFR